MQAMQFFLFGLLIVWLIGTGKLGAFVEALRSQPSGGGGSDKKPGTGGIGGSIEIGGCQPTVDGRTNFITGAYLDPSRPICRYGPLSGGVGT